MEKLILQNIENNQADMWRFIEEIVNVDSGYDCLEGIDQVAHIVGDTLEKIGFTVEYLTKQGPTQVLARRPRPGKPKVMIMGHTDTVFGKGTVAQRPFKIVAGKAYGPGVMDMKSGIGIGVYTIKSLLEAGFDDADITFLFAGDEEINHPESDAVENFKRYGQGMDAVFNMEPGREQGEVVIARKGLWRPVIKIKGIAAHSGNNYYIGASAILEMARKTVDLFAMSDKSTGTTCNVGVISGGTLANIVAGSAECKIDVRFEKVAEAEKAMQKVREICMHSYDERTTTELVDRGAADYMPPFEKTEGGMRLLAFLQKEAAALGQKPLVGIHVGGSSDACYTTMVGSPTVCAMGPQSVGPHSDNEFAYVEAYVPRCQLLAMAILHLREFITA